MTSDLFQVMNLFKSVWSVSVWLPWSNKQSVGNKMCLFSSSEKF